MPEENIQALAFRPKDGNISMEPQDQEASSEPQFQNCTMEDVNETVETAETRLTVDAKTEKHVTVADNAQQLGDQGFVTADPADLPEQKKKKKKSRRSAAKRGFVYTHYISRSTAANHSKGQTNRVGGILCRWSNDPS